MADTPYYIDNRLTTGANDGSTPEDAWRSFADYDASGTIANQIGDSINLIEGSGPYFRPRSNAGTSIFDGKANGNSSGNPTTWNCNKCIISAMIDANDGTYLWNESATDGEWYLTLANGTDPSLTQVENCLVDGNPLIQNADDDVYNRQLGTVGSLGSGVPTGTENYSAGWGGNGGPDSLLYDTLYVKSDVNPSTRQIWFAAETNPLIILWNYHTFNDAIFIGGNAGNFKATQLEVTLNRCIAMFGDFSGITSDQGVGPLNVTNCLTYWAGHRGIDSVRSGVTINAFNCTDWGSHLGLHISDIAVGTFNYKNCIIANNEAGAIQNESATTTINENNNWFYPRMTAAGGALGYLDPANWTPTDATDNPASTATTENDQGNLVDPEFQNPDDFAFYTKRDNLNGLYDYLAEGFTLKSTSPALGSGAKLWTGANTIGLDGEPMADFETDPGCVQSKHNASHPTNL